MRDDVQVGKDAQVGRTGPYEGHAFVYRVWGSQSWWEVAIVSASLIYLVA